jgi:hypothetical protein
MQAIKIQLEDLKYAQQNSPKSQVNSHIKKGRGEKIVFGEIKTN